MASSLSHAIEKAGVVGAGGGGFPTHIKASAEAEVVLANGAECEPLLRCDSAAMTAYPERVMKGLILMKEAVGATRCVVAVRRSNEHAVKAMSSEIRGLSDVELFSLENVYPAGDEYLLVYEVTRRVVPEGGIPLDVGVVVSNVNTLQGVADAALGRPATRRLVTVQGEVASPGTFWAPIGTAIGEIIACAGPVTTESPGVIVGGPMMGEVTFDLTRPLTKTEGGLIVLPKEHTLIVRRVAPLSSVLRTARAACCQCLACTELCPRALLGHELAPHRTVRAVQYSLEAVEHDQITSAFLCSECGMCELFACPMGVQPARILGELKRELSEQGFGNPHRRAAPAPDSVREYRQIPTARLVQRLGLAPYDRPAPFENESAQTGRVVLKMKQHVGVSATPVAKEGQRVLAGDVIGEIPEGQLGARVHASITGIVESVSSNDIVVRA